MTVGELIDKLKEFKPEDIIIGNPKIEIWKGIENPLSSITINFGKK